MKPSKQLQTFTILALVVFLTGCSGDKGTLLDAIRSKNIQRVKEILDEGHVTLDPVARSIHENNRPLAYAAAYGNLKIVELLVAKGADLNGATAYGDVPLIKADEHGNQDIAKYLIRQGADVNKPNAFGITPFIGFCAQGNVELVKLAIAHSANLDARFQPADPGADSPNFAPLEAAVHYGKTQTVKVLLQEGADASIQDGHGNTLESIAKKKGFSEIAKLLRNHKTE